jgi:hypothetical protein
MIRLPLSAAALPSAPAEPNLRRMAVKHRVNAWRRKRIALHLPPQWQQFSPASRLVPIRALKCLTISL